MCNTIQYFGMCSAVQFTVCAILYNTRVQPKCLVVNGRKYINHNSVYDTSGGIMQTQPGLCVHRQERYCATEETRQRNAVSTHES